MRENSKTCVGSQGWEVRREGQRTFLTILLITVHPNLYMSFYHCSNRLQLAFSCVMVWAGFCLVLANAYPGFDAAILLFLGAPLTGIVGAGLADMRALRVFQAPISALWTSFEVELKARYTLHACLWGGNPTSERAITTEAAEAAAKTIASDCTDAIADEEAAFVVATQTDTMKTASRTSKARSATATPVDSALDSIEARTHAARMLLSAEQLSMVERVFTDGVTAFTSSPLLHIGAARFYGILRSCRHLLLTHLLRAARLRPGIDAELFSMEVRTHVTLRARAECLRSLYICGKQCVVHETFARCLHEVLHHPAITIRIRFTVAS
jgi:hypothetical protein